MCRFDHIGGKPDASQIRVRLAEPFQQVKASVHHVMGIFPALDEKPARWDIELKKP